MIVVDQGDVQHGNREIVDCRFVTDSQWMERAKLATRGMPPGWKIVYWKEIAARYSRQHVQFLEVPGSRGVLTKEDAERIQVDSILSTANEEKSDVPQTTENRSELSEVAAEA